MRRFLLFGLCLVMLAGAQVLPVAGQEAAVMAERVPTFQLRARLLMAGDQPADGRSFNFRFNVPSDVVASVGREWSDWLMFGLPQAEAALQRYPNTYLRRFPIVISLTVGGMIDPTLMEAEVWLDGAEKPVQLTGDLYGPSL